MEALLSVSVVLYRVVPIRSRASPFIVPRRGLGYMYRRQSRGRYRYGTLTYSRPLYRHGLKPSCLGTLMMIMRASISRSVRRPGLAYLLYACTSWQQLRWSG